MTAPRLTFPAKGPSENIIVGFNFADLLDDDETLVSATFISSSPSELVVSGVAGIIGTIARQRVTGGNHGKTYFLRCVVTTSLDNTREAGADFPVRNGGV